MKLLLFFIFCNFTSASLGAEDMTSCGSEPPWQAEASLSRGSTTVTHFTSPRDVGPNIWRQWDSCLHVSQSGSSWWVSRLADTIFEIDEFIDDHRLLVIAYSITTNATYLLDLDDKDLRRLGGGSGTYIGEGENQGLVLLRGQKRYRPKGGAYWLDVLVDLSGEIVEFVPGDGPECMRISEILYEGESVRQLRQDIDQCIGIPRV